MVLQDAKIVVTLVPSMVIDVPREVLDVVDTVDDFFKEQNIKEPFPELAEIVSCWLKKDQRCMLPFWECSYQGW